MYRSQIITITAHDWLSIQRNVTEPRPVVLMECTNRTLPFPPLRQHAPPTSCQPVVKRTAAQVSSPRQVPTGLLLPTPPDEIAQYMLSRHSSLEEESFERIASPASDPLSVGGLFEMDDNILDISMDTEKAPPIITADIMSRRCLARCRVKKPANSKIDTNGGTRR